MANMYHSVYVGGTTRAVDNRKISVLLKILGEIYAVEVNETKR